MSQAEYKFFKPPGIRYKLMNNKMFYQINKHHMEDMERIVLYTGKKDYHA